MAHILLAEADASTRITLGAMLEAEHHSVVLVTSPLQLASALDHDVIDLALIDLAMIRGRDDNVRRLHGVPVVGIEPSDGIAPDSSIRVTSRLFRPVDVDAALVFVTAALASVLPSAGLGAELEGPQGVSVRLAAGQAYVRSRLLRLTRREFEILVLLLRHRGQQVTVDQIARTVWGLEQISSRNFIEAQISRLRKKLAAAGAPRTIQTVRDVGYQISWTATRDWSEPR